MTQREVKVDDSYKFNYYQQKCKRTKYKYLK